MTLNRYPRLTLFTMIPIWWIDFLGFYPVFWTLYEFERYSQRFLSFPEVRDYQFEISEGFIAGSKTVTYVFDDPGPPLALSMVDGGKHMLIKDVGPVNRVLAYLNLPPVAEGVQELAAITGRSLDTDKYRWDDYERGILILERGICHDMTSAQSFTCIARITIRSR